MELEIFRVTNTRLTGREAADRFARLFWETPREIAEWDDDCFKLAGGVAWYQVVMHADGWSVVRNPQKKARPA